ncbi:MULTISPECIES: DUF5681 domain-containing protein [Hyphobacterium]|uniref:DUF5681 domain-containing protein n=1 Tax=Hyphobacterium vulgare TaxID=1736751 RepID=A0ABV6ZVL1_9PROT
MSDSSEDDYEVGYGKPPKSTRFKKGQSGNPRGRPKKLASTVAGQVSRLMREQYSARVNGEVVSMTGEEMIARRLMEKALKGDPKAFEKVHQLTNQHQAEIERIATIEHNPKPLVIELVHARIPEEECYKKPGERIHYSKEENTVTRESWPGYLPEEAKDSGSADITEEPNSDMPGDDDGDRGDDPDEVDDDDDVGGILGLG